jgi:hypothetical protein
LCIIMTIKARKLLFFWIAWMKATLMTWKVVLELHFHLFFILLTRTICDQCYLWSLHNFRDFCRFSAKK